MITLTGYEIKEEIYFGEKSAVYRAVKSNKPVIIKVLHNEYPDPIELSAFKQEYEILEKFQSPNNFSSVSSVSVVRVLGLEKYKNSFAIIFEDIGAESLSRILTDSRDYSLDEILSIMLKSAKALEEVHKLGLVHKDIKSHNIIFNKQTGELQLIDFGNASHLAKQNSYTPLNSSIEGTIAYISPEQTGRMNRTVDYRTDYYSLGVTFYQLLTGELPFISNDSMELVHAHIAKTPVSPQEKKNISKIISDIVMKLLQKNPEDRYQGIAGLVYDLEWCLNNVVRTRDGVSSTENGFQIGMHDFSGKFQIPEKLYGRIKEIAQIIETFKKVVKGNTELLLISGRSGIGKSALINEVNKPITEYKGYFASGKYDQFKRAIPYHAIAQVFQSLIQQVLTADQEEITLWKTNLLQALGSNGKIMIDLVPELETLIGEQPAVIELGPSESQNRFNLVFQNFISIFCTKEHPIAIFLDDLQWADTPSISLIQTILSNPEMKYLYLMLSFRDNEVLPTDPLSLMLEALRKSGFVYKEILLESISVSDISHLVSDTLSCEESRARELATILFEKTKGNPFFVNETFKSLYDKDLIEYSEGTWKWEISKIREIKMSENVIDLMVEKVKELSPNQIELLKLAACIGDSFRIENFFELTNQDIDVLNQELTIISNEGFLILTKNQVRFVHDKVREATYTLLSDEEKVKNHYAIGSAYLKMSKEEVDDLVFTIVAQLNQGISLMNEQEKNRLLVLNLQAGKKAMSSSANESALVFLTKAKELLPEDAWNVNYELASSLYFSLSEAEYVNTHFDEAEKLFEYIFQNVKTNLEKVKINKVRIPLYFRENRLKQALDTSLASLKLLNIDLPENPPEEVLYAEINEANENLKKYSIPSLLDLQTVQDKEVLALHEDLAEKVTLVYVAAPQLTPIIILKLVNSSIKSGNSPVSTFGYTMFGMLKISVFGDFKSGLELGKLGLQLLEKYDSLKVSSRVFFFYTTTIVHWVEHPRNSFELFRKGIENARATGDLQFASYSCNHLCLQSYFIREPLAELVVKMDNYLHVLKKLKIEDAIEFFAYFHQLSHNLHDDRNDKNLELMIGDYCNEEESIPKLRVANNLTILAIAFLSKAIAAYLFGNYKNAYEFSKENEAYMGGVFGMMVVPERNFIYSLSCLALYETETSLEKKQEYLEQIQKNQESMKVWGENCPANYGHKYYIIEAELASLKIETGDNSNLDEKKTNVINLFDTAIKLAKEHSYLFEEAVANEFLAKFWYKIGKEAYGIYHIEAAHYAYKLWGCKPRIKELEEKYPQLKRQATHNLNSNMTVSSSSTATTQTVTGGSFLDLNTVVKASQTISGEIQLGKLLEKMMKILFENAGAERGFFILKEKERWLIQAEGNANTETISVLQAKLLGGNSDLSPNIVNYVIRTKSIILLNDALKKGMFVNDAYVKEKQPKSILCYPVINQGNLVGAVYLENNLTTDAFTPDRVEILKILSSQIAVSVENSLLYANLEEKVEERTRDLNQALVEVRGLKEQQDGDYFLNTLLIEPLGQNNAFSKQVEIEFFIKQKKNFIFRKKEHELGGDINISENIELMGRSYIVFLNGDAMGKSIQGAGGVLVLGTVFKSIIQRTISITSGKNVYPERWLKNAFIEMHKAFESFEGSMLMSAVFGLIDERTGTMYFMNAEHPDMVLYRDGLASFIENPNQYRKFGTQGQTGSISIEIFSLRPDDVVILGSDGRDDVVLGKDSQTGNDIINQDEKLFLHHVKNGDGYLDAIYKEIMKAGKQMDDLSLLKIHYKGVTANRERLNEDLKLLEEYKETREFDKYAEVGVRLISDYPHLTNTFYEVSHAFKQIGQFDKAIDFGERMRLRDPKNLDNLVNLIDSYNGIGKKERTKVILDACLKMKPEDERLMKWKEELG